MTRWAPVDELDRALRLDRRHGGVHVLRHDVATVHHAARHVLAVARVALHHHARRLEHAVGDLGDAELLVVRLLGRDDRRVGREHEVDARVRHEVGLELGDVHVERAVEAERRGERGDHLAEEAVQVRVRRALDIEVPAANVIEPVPGAEICTMSVIQFPLRSRISRASIDHLSSVSRTSAEHRSNKCRSSTKQRL